MEPPGNRTPVRAEYAATPLTLPSTPTDVESLGRRTPLKVETATMPTTPLTRTPVKVDMQSATPLSLPSTPTSSKLKHTASLLQSPMSDVLTMTPKMTDSDYVPSLDSPSEGDDSYVETPKKKKKPKFHFKPKSFYPKPPKRAKVVSPTSDSKSSDSSDSKSSDSDSSNDTSSGSEAEFKPKKIQPKKVQTKKGKGRKRGGVYQQFMASDSEEDESKMSAAQLQRKRNIEAQQEFLRKLDMEETKRELSECFKPKKTNKPREVKPKASLPPREKSVRIQTIQKVQTFSTRAGKSQDVTPTLRMDEIMYREFNAEDFTDYFVRLHTKLYDPTELKPEMDLKTCSLEEFEAKFSSLTLRNEQSMKVLPDPISAFAVHPSRNIMLLGAGGKSGSVGFWNVDVDAGDWDDSNIMVFLPHLSNVTALTFSEYDVNAVFSCSTDGTVRHGDLNKQTFELIYAEDSVVPLHWITQQCPTVLYSSKLGGHIVRIDTRIPFDKQHNYRTRHTGPINTLSLNPRNRDHLLSSCEDKWIVLWDLRMMGTRRYNSPLWQYNTSFPVSAGFFSGSGSRILTTSGTDLACIYETNGNFEPFKSWEVRRAAPHGRPPNAVAKAVWHPQREDEFCVPNNKEGLDVYRCEYTTDPLHSARQSLHLPMKRCTQAAFHPTLPAVVASCNHSLHLFL